MPKSLGTNLLKQTHFDHLGVIIQIRKSDIKMLHEYTKKRIGQLHKGNLNSAEIARVLDEEGIRVHRSTVFRYLRRKEGAHHPQKTAN